MRHVVILNPAKSVRGERYSAIEGKTPKVTPKLTARLLESIDTGNVVGLRDYAIIALLAIKLGRAASPSLPVREFPLFLAPVLLLDGHKNAEHVVFIQLISETTEEGGLTLDFD